MKNIIKRNILAIISFTIAFGCVISFNIIGSKVTPDGTLVEPFFLVPICFLFIAIGMISIIVSFFTR
ncbi:DUF3955 domain-containing protein [Haloimpatiens sp. FM7330]|uniref:DUF3955 domain-containing protein n=1 Tax=Haloimpatiens sp. FM7330 TaxID=3298610 RepID=UPI003638847B